MSTNTNYHDLIAKRQKLREVSDALKKQFLGLDAIIDEVISLLMPWYLFPEAQLRPTVINLWGLTGSGKTALVYQLIELLQHKQLFAHIDMGEFESDSASWLKNILTDDMDFFDGKPAVLCLDEFQFARTLSQNGEELGKDKLRVIWELIDSGKISYTSGSNSFYLFRAESCLKRIEKALRVGVRLEQGVVVAEEEWFVTIFEGFYFDNHDQRNRAINKDYFISSDFLEGMRGLMSESEITKEDVKRIVSDSSLAELANHILHAMKMRSATRQLDLSRSLIFILGNLDEAYHMSHNINPDMSADDFYEQTSKITIANIKRALKKRFRPEQVARLGNNHIIYRSFNQAQFRQLIELQFERIAAFVQQQFAWHIQFDASVTDVIYAEGVFPSQGTRPIFTTIKNMIESRISKMAVMLLEENLPVKNIRWYYEQQHFYFELRDEQNQFIKTISDLAVLKLENLRKSCDPEIQAHTAVHEAGHAVLAVATLHIIPALIVSRTASDSEDGFCQINFPKGPVTRDTLRKDIIITLGGYVAEKLIFGESFTSTGVYMDIEEASSLANKAVRNYAMGNDPIHMAIKTTNNNNVFLVSQKYEVEALELIKACEEEAMQLMKRNKLLLLKLSEYLTTHSRMEETLIEEYVVNYGAEEWMNRAAFVKKENYYTFNTTLQKQLKQLETSAVDELLKECYELQV
ncbi:MAG: hypothetical protein HOP30_05500 [Cyclobacteriaceae bacterium]|nr:hypothetical protein [Cyclobacteriaceae bacterium]